jgi:hypothetical protein
MPPRTDRPYRSPTRSNNGQPSEFDRFRDLTRDLLRVPKDELDAEVKRQEEERSRARRAKGR